MGLQPHVPAELAQRLVRYDHTTGKLYWRPRPASMFKAGGHSAAHTCARWNSRWAGAECFTSVTHGYLSGFLSDRKYPAHSVAWAVHHGRWPDMIDHVNGNRSDNRIENLREVTHSENLRNQARRSDNTSGVTGVYWATSKRKWAAYIKADKVIALGRYDTFIEAVAARKAAEKVLGYHPNHGRLPPVG